MKYILLIITVVLCSVSCSDWLDVRPETEQKDQDQFSTVNGFFDALTGCYMSMADKNVYGERLTMSNIESLANLWATADDQARLEDRELARHDYTKDNARTAIKAIYGGLFKVIAQANMIIKYAGERSDVFTDASLLKMVEGEAYAIRAYCQLDVLRLFGQMPSGGTGSRVELPYSFTTSINEVPAYYGQDAYVELLKTDINKALQLLKEGDPLFEYTFSELNGSGTDVANNHQLYRQSRLNYWAVKALQARMFLYLGDENNAHTVAREIIDAKGTGGNPVMTMSGRADIAAGYMAYPNECLFYMSKYDLLDNAQELLIGGSRASYTTSCLAITSQMFTDLYEDMPANYLNSHNRYQNCWGTTETSTTHEQYRTVMKYYWDDEKAKNQMLYYQVIPMIRMSEVYLIAMETAELSEANTLFQDYMEEHAVSAALLADFTSREAVREFILKEYRREFYAEGQMFFTYKRRSAVSILWYNGTVSESLYVLPLPETEYNPNNL